MELYFFRGEAPNFGDELSGWLMPKVFPGLFDRADGRLFLGIGSIIFDTHKAEQTKIVFGSGYSGYTPLPKFDDSWRFYCVRGPQTARLCGLGPEQVAADSAILIRDFWRPSGVKTHRASFMPHFRSIPYGQWQLVCKLAGIHFIDPRSPVDEVLQDIAESDLLLTEAMHGAIVADALRTPWVPISPFNPINRAKWTDWAAPLDLVLRFNNLSPSSWHEASLRVRGRELHALKSLDRTLAAFSVDAPFVAIAAASLQAARRHPAHLSADQSLDRANDRLNTFAQKIRSDFSHASV